MDLQMLGRAKRNPSLTRQNKQWAYDYLPISSDVSLSVMELECHEPGCPPIETVIAAMEQGKSTQRWITQISAKHNSG